jgi:HEAT repeat protein
MALGKQQGRFREELLALGRHPERTVRLAALAGMEQEAGDGSVWAVDELGRRLTDPNGEMRWAAAAALGQARGAAIRRALSWLDTALASADQRVLSGAAFGAVALSPVRPAIAARVLLRLAESGPAGRKAVAAALVHLPGRGLARAARLCLADRDPQVRALVVPALGRWAAEGWRWAAPCLPPLTRDRSAAVRAAAAGVLAAHGELAPPALLCRLAADRSPEVRAAVAEALARPGRGGVEGSRGEEVADLLQQLASDRAVMVRAAAIRSLGAVGGHDALLTAGVDREPMVRAAAAASLEPRGVSEVDLLLRLTGDRHAPAALAATRTLCRHMLDLPGPMWEQVVSLASNQATALAAAEGIAAAFDQDPKRLPVVFYWWPLRAATTSVIWQVARCARTPEVAELARCAARALEGGEDLGKALRDLSLALRFVERDDLAEVFSWLGDCADAATPEEVVRQAATCPAGSFDAVSFVVAAAKMMKQAVRARSRLSRDRYLARARAALAAGPTHDRERAYWPLVLPILHNWELLVDRMAQEAAPADLRVALVSQHLVAGPSSLLLISVENAGQGRAWDLLVGIEGAPVQDIACLRPGEEAQVGIEVRHTRPGTRTVRGLVRFRDALGWHSQAIADRVQAVRPTPLMAVANPYVVGKPLAADSAMFFGRAGEIAFVERALTSGDEGNVVVLVGQRRTGKTSLLKRLEARLAQWCRPTFIDVQGMLVDDTGAFFQELARRALPKTSEPMVREAGAAPYDSYSSGPEQVQEAADRLEGRVVLLLDEFDDLEQKVRTGVLGPEVFSQLRHLIQHSRNISFVLSGSDRLEELAGEHWSFLLNLATHRRIGCLKPEVAEQVIRVPLGRLGVVCEEAALARAITLTGRNPYLLQLLGYRLVERCVQLQEAAVRVSLVEEAAADVVEQGDIHLRYLWESAGPQGQPILGALAGHQSRPGDRSLGKGGLSVDELRRVTGLDSAGVRRAVRALAASELVAEQAGQCVLQVGLLSLWLRQGGPR